MKVTQIEAVALTKAVLALVAEAYDEAADPRATWFTDNEPKNGVLGTVESLSAEEASCPLSSGDPISAASHVEHLRFSLSLANRALRGENPYKGVHWSSSWSVKKVDAGTWKTLLASLRSEYEALREVLATGAGWSDEDTMTGVFGTIAHGAWHLGALRQGLGKVRSPASA